MRFAAWLKLRCRHPELELAVAPGGDLYYRCVDCHRSVDP